MQSLIIISLKNNIDNIVKILNEADYGSNLLQKSNDEYMLVQKKRYYKFQLADETTPGFQKMKADFADFFADIETKHKDVKVKLLNYLGDSKGAINIFCEKGFSSEGFNLVSNLAKTFKGIILSGGVFVNSDHEVLLAFDGTSETNDFIGNPELIVENKEEKRDRSQVENNTIISKVKSLKLLVNENLPEIEDIENIQFRDKIEIAKRALALTFIASYAEGVIETNEIREVRKFFLSLLKDYQVTSDLTEAEMNFIYEYRPTQNQLIDFSWEYEGAYALMWVLGYVEDLSFPPLACEAHKLVNIIKQFTSFEEFIENSNLRSKEELIEAYELAYRTQRAVDDTESIGRIIPGGIDLNVIRKRNKTFQWITNYKNAPWDKI